MPNAKRKQTASERVDEIVDELLVNPLDKSDRIRLFKELIARGEEMSEDVFQDALKRLMERLLD